VDSDVAIIGGGPSGLWAAYCLTQKEPSCVVTLYERNSDVGSKLLLSGASQCNVTHNTSSDEMRDHYYDKKEFLRKAFSLLGPQHTMNVLKGLGLALLIRPDNKVFPSSLQAQDVKDLLKQRCLNNKVNFCYNTRILSISKEGEDFMFTDQHNHSHKAHQVIIATGGLTYPQTGSTGDGYVLAQQMGHSLIAPRPALRPLPLKHKELTALAGLSVEKVILSDQKQNTTCGALLITHSGLSGPAALHLSHYIHSETTITINWLAEPYTEKQLTNHILTLCNEKGSSQLATIIHSLNIPKNLVDYLLDKAGINHAQKAAEVGKKSLQKIVPLLLKDQYMIADTFDVHKAMVTTGGVNTEEVDDQTMESKKERGLYFCGEVLDIDGESGGYNLQVAFSTATAATLGECPKEDILSILLPDKR